MRTKAFYLFALIVLSLGCWESAGYVLSHAGPDWLVALPTAAWLLASALALAATSVSHIGWIYAELVVLAVSTLCPALLLSVLPDGMAPGFGTYLLIPVTSVLTILLLYSGMAFMARQRADPVDDGDSHRQRKQAERAAAVPVLSALTWVCWETAGGLFGFKPLRVSGWLSEPLGWLIELAIVLLLVSALTLASRKVRHGVWILAALLLLMGLSLPASVINNIFTGSPEPPLALTVIPSVALFVAALLLHSGLSAYREWRRASTVEAGPSQAQRSKRARRAAGVLFVVSAVLLAKTLHHVYRFTVWDNTYDSLGYLLLLVPVPAALLSGVKLSITLSRRVKWVGFLYSLLILGSMIGISARAQAVDFRQLTEERAERVTQAIETYHSREDHYPQDLGQLTPRYALWLPRPVIIYGQDWCYDGGDDYYRLGYVDREHWSDPRLIGRVYRIRGDVPDLHGMCEEEVAAMQERYPDYPYEYWMDGE